ncbi:MAG TPA: hypothetical protein VI542_31490, partial [Candidatus Tectomicrobia bacterium]
MVPRYPTDLTDTEWTLLAPLIPAAKPGGRPCTTAHCRKTPDGAPHIAPCDRTFPCAVVWHIYGTLYGHQRRC